MTKYNKNYDDDENLTEDVPEEFVPKNAKELEREAENNIDNFTKLLDTLSSLHDRKKVLWKEIYENATLDRRNAYIMFGDLYQKVHSDPTQHAIHGQNLTKYLERMSKANEQIIKLAEILDDAVEQDEEIITDEDDFYNKMEHSKKK
jgi:hypothetical protein